MHFHERARLSRKVCAVGQSRYRMHEENAERRSKRRGKGESEPVGVSPLFSPFFRTLSALTSWIGTMPGAFSFTPLVPLFLVPLCLFLLSFSILLPVFLPPSSSSSRLSTASAAVFFLLLLLLFFCFWTSCYVVSFIAFFSVSFSLFYFPFVGSLCPTRNDCLWNSGVERSAYSLLGWKISRKFSSIKEQESSLSIVLEVLLKFVSAYWWKKKHEISSHSKWKNYSNSIIVFGIMLNFHQDSAFFQFLIEWNMNKLKRFRKEKKLK